MFVSEYQKFKNILNNTEYQKITDWNDWLYGLGIISSRAFLTHKNSEYFPVLIPVLDFINYDSAFIENFSSGYKVNKNDEFVLVAERDFSASDEVLWSYGKKDSNKELLWAYGFVAENNPYDCIEILNEKSKFCRFHNGSIDNVVKNYQNPEDYLKAFGKVLKDLKENTNSLNLIESVNGNTVLKKVLKEENELMLDFSKKIFSFIVKMFGKKLGIF